MSMRFNNIKKIKFFQIIEILTFYLNHCSNCKSKCESISNNSSAGMSWSTWKECQYHCPYHFRQKFVNHFEIFCLFKAQIGYIFVNAHCDADLWLVYRHLEIYNISVSRKITNTKSYYHRWLIKMRKNKIINICLKLIKLSFA